jgi:putative ABC transport system permease protein
MNLYCVLLHLYPSSFRLDYGEEMASIFSRQLKTQSGFGIVRFWLAAIREIVVNAAGLHWEIARRDLRYGVASLLRSPGFTLTAILLVTIGIGANAAIFTLVDFVLVRPLPFPGSDRLATVWENHPGYSRMELSPANYRDFRAASTSFENLAAYSHNSMSLVGQGEPLRLDGFQVTGNLFSTLQRSPLLGRYLEPRDDTAGAPGSVVLSYSLWQTVFAGDPAVVGKSIYLDNSSYTVVGVMPADFLFPSRDTQYWTAFRFQEEDYQDRTNTYLGGIGRLKPGVSLDAARTELGVIATRLRKQYPKENQAVGASVAAIRDELSTQSRFLLWALCGAAICVLVIACANLANLLLARSLAKEKELAIRLSLGANRRHILRQLLSESALLGLAGGAGAIGLAALAMPLLAQLVPNALPVSQVPPIDSRMLFFALGLTMLTIVGFGVAPAFWASRSAAIGNLRTGSRTAGSANQRARTTLVIAEVAVSVVLLACSGLLIRALWRVQGTDPGFRTENILTLRTQLPFPRYEKTAVRKQFYDNVLTQVRHLPGVTGAGYTSFLPMTWGGGILPVQVKGVSDDRRLANNASMRFITPGFFSVMEIPIKLGRDVSEADSAGRPYVAVVSESFAKRYWPEKSPIGQHFDFGFHDREVIGVVRDIRVRGLERTSEPQVYLSYQQVDDGFFPIFAPKDLVVHSSQPVEQVLPAIRQIVHNIDSEQPISNVRTVAEVIAGQTESRTVQMRVLIIFTAVAVLLAGLGIYGLLSFAVAMRQQEFGIRMALGAQQAHIFKVVLKQGVWLAAAGVLPGLLLAYLAARLLQSLLAGVNPGDALTFCAAALLCMVTALLGTLMPALRAVRADPSSVMRAE